MESFDHRKEGISTAHEAVNEDKAGLELSGSQGLGRGGVLCCSLLEVRKTNAVHIDIAAYRHLSEIPFWPKCSLETLPETSYVNFT